MICILWDRVPKSCYFFEEKNVEKNGKIFEKILNPAIGSGDFFAILEPFSFGVGFADFAFEFGGLVEIDGHVGEAGLELDGLIFDNQFGKWLIAVRNDLVESGFLLRNFIKNSIKKAYLVYNKHQSQN